ncbi:MAG: chorismate mutase [Thiohalomonadales bacterium]
MKLDKLRNQIDSIDETMVDLIAKRFDITSAIGVIKCETGINSSSPEREAKQFSKLEILAQERNLPYKLVESIFRLIIDEVVRNHDTLKKQDDSL